MGIITIFLSDSLVSGYTAAAAFTILITQIKFLFGLNGAEAFVEPGFFTTPRVRKMFESSQIFVKEFLRSTSEMRMI